MMNWKLVNAWTVADTPEAWFTLEEFRDGEKQMMCVHLKLKTRCTAALLREMLDTWRKFIKHVTCPLYTFNFNEDEKWRHFISLFGFKPFTEAIWADGKVLQIYWHSNEQLTAATKQQHLQQQHDQLREHSRVHEQPRQQH